MSIFNAFRDTLIIARRCILSKSQQMHFNVGAPLACRALLLGLLLLTHPQSALAQKIIKLATTERIPYAGKNLTNQGYVPELIREVFKDAGYELSVTFLPLARAVLAAEAGTVDAVAPHYFEAELQEAFVYSAPFPGDHLGLLKKKATLLPTPNDADFSSPDRLLALQDFRFGIVRGITVTPEFDSADFLSKYYTSSNLSLVDMLAADRIHIGVMDKYTAADIMVEQRPHLIGALEFFPFTPQSKPFHVAFSKNSPEYQQRKQDFDRSLLALKARGKLTTIREKHGLFDTEKIEPGKTKLTIGTVSNAEMKIMQILAKEFEASHPDIQLDWRVNDEGTLRRRLLSDLAISDHQFDIMTVGSFEAHFWAQNNWLTPLNNLPDHYDLNDILKPFRDVVTHNGQLHALPFYGESLMTYYRTDLFADAGIEMPAAPTYTDIFNFAEKIHNPQEQIYGLCLRGQAGWGANMSYFNTLLHTHGGRWFDENWNAQLQSPIWKKTLALYADIVTRFSPPTTPTNNFNENKKLFSEGRCGIWIDATVAASSLFDARQSKVHDKVGFANAPIAETRQGSRWLWSWSLAIPASSAHVDEAKKFITWATSKDYINLVAKRYGWLNIPPGTRRSSYQNKNYQAVAPFANFVLDAIQKSDFTNNTLKPSPYTGNAIIYIPEYPALGYQVGLQLNKVIRGELTVESALRNSQEIVSQQMIDSGYFE